jgi:hypothetical protein
MRIEFNFDKDVNIIEIRKLLLNLDKETLAKLVVKFKLYSTAGELTLEEIVGKNNSKKLLQKVYKETAAHIVKHVKESCAEIENLYNKQFNSSEKTSDKIFDDLFNNLMKGDL